MTRRSRGRTLVAALFVVLAVNGWLQSVPVLFGEPTDSIALAAWQAVIGAVATATAWSAWRGLRWAPAAAAAYGVVTSAMLVALPFLVGIPSGERGGIWVGAAVVFAIGAWAAWYLARITPSPVSREESS